MDAGLLMLRVVLGLVMAAHGAQKLFGWFGGYGLAGTGGFFESIGFRPGRFFAMAAGTSELVGGLLVALGLLGPLGPAMIVAIMIVAAATVHWQHGLFASNNGIELTLLYAVGAAAIALIGNGAYSLATAIKMGRALEELDFYWFEEPLPQPNHAGYEVLASTLDIAIAGGEGLGSREQFKNLIERRAVDIVQPDVSLCGGFAECLFVAEFAKLWAVPCMPHCWGGAIIVAATVHLLALLPDASWARTTETPMLEMDTAENPFRDQLAGSQLHIGKDGLVAVPSGPGLGIEIDEEMVKRYAIG